MANGYSKQIQEQIKAAAEGTIFISSDFADIADTETIRRNLNRLTQAGMLRRILKGVYEKPKYSKLLDEYVAADPEAVANALARSYHSQFTISSEKPTMAFNGVRISWLMLARKADLRRSESSAFSFSSFNSWAIFSHLVLLNLIPV